MSLAIAGAAVVFFSLMAFWKHEPLLFMMASGASLIVGLQWFHIYTTDSGLTISLMLILYSLVCGAFAYATLLSKGEKDSD